MKPLLRVLPSSGRRLDIEDPRNYFPDLLSGWYWGEGPTFGEGAKNGISYRAGVGGANVDTARAAMISIYTATTSEDTSNLLRLMVSDLQGYGAAVQRTGFLGDESWELYGPSELGGIDVWQVCWRRNSVLGLIFSPSKDDAYAWVDAADALFPKARLPIPWQYALAGVGIVGVVIVIALAKR